MNDEIKSDTSPRIQDVLNFKNRAVIDNLANADRVKDCVGVEDHWEESALIDRTCTSMQLNRYLTLIEQQ